MIGIDEVGRGAWAGPLVVAAVGWDQDRLGHQAWLDDLQDSKSLKVNQRQQIFNNIKAHIETIGLGWASADLIDRIGLTGALKQACQLALTNAGVDHNWPITIDGPVNYLPAYGGRVSCRIKADQTIPTVMAAGIVAKVVRDNFCQQLDRLYPGYQLGTHKGYGTLKHQLALKQYGPQSGLHRLSWPCCHRFAT